MESVQEKLAERQKLLETKAAGELLNDLYLCGVRTTQLLQERTGTDNTTELDCVAFDKLLIERVLLSRIEQKTED